MNPGHWSAELVLQLNVNLWNILVDDLDDVAHDRGPGEGDVDLVAEERRVVVKAAHVQAAGLRVVAFAHHLLDTGYEKKSS